MFYVSIIKCGLNKQELTYMLMISSLLRTFKCPFIEPANMFGGANKSFIKSWKIIQNLENNLLSSSPISYLLFEKLSWTFNNIVMLSFWHSKKTRCHTRFNVRFNDVITWKTQQHSTLKSEFILKQQSKMAYWQLHKLDCFTSNKKNDI